MALPALASADYQWRDQFSVLSGEENPRRVAVEQSTGNAFFVDEGTGRVRVFEPLEASAEPLTEFGAGELDSPYGIAIDESGAQTAVYVSDAGTNSIVRYLSDGAPTPSFELDETYTSPLQGTGAGQVESFAAPLALAPNGDLWVADGGANELKRFDDTGAHVAGSDIDGSTSPGGAFANLLDIAANSAGDLYVVDASGPGELGKEEVTSRVLRFAADGTYKAKLGPLGFRDRSAVVAVNPANDQVVVSGDEDAIGHDEHEIRTRLFLFGSDDEPIEELRVNADYTQGGSIRGLAFHGATRDPLYVAVGRAWYYSPEFEAWAETAGWPSFHLMSEAIPPTLSIDPASAVTSNSATISGEIDPYGVLGEWQVQFRRSGAAEWENGGFNAVGTSPTDVSETIEGLIAGEEYEARLQGTSNDGTSESSVVTFTTDTAAPRISAQSAVAGSDGATLRARINPNGSEVSYHFEYGLTAAYGSSTPVTTIPAGNSAVDVSAEIDGLTPGTTYHFRVVAESTDGDAEGADATFTTQGSADGCANAQYRTGTQALLSDCRAYEMVTPAGEAADLRVGGGPTTPDGRTVCFNTEDPMVGSDPNGIKLADDGFCAWRGADGWETKWVTGPTPEKRFASMGGNVYFLSPDGKRAVFASDQFLFKPDYISPSASSGTQMRSYMWEGGETTELSPAPTPIVIPGFGEFFTPENSSAHKRPLAASEDLTHGIFQSTNNLVPEDTNYASDIYEWSPEGLRIVSTADDSDQAAGGEPLSIYDEQLTGTGWMSTDGSRTFFMHEGAPLDSDADPGAEPETVPNVYVRDGDEVTLVSPRGGVLGADELVRFGAASSDGDKVYFESFVLQGDFQWPMGKAIYVYDVSEGELELFASRPGGVELLGASPDGSTVVYRSLGAYNVYVVRDGVTTLLGTLAPNERGINAESDTGFRLGSLRSNQRTLRFTPDGSTVVFASAGEFAGSTGGVVQVYRWSEEDGLEVISAGASAPTKNASIGAYSGDEAGDPREEFLANHRFKSLEGRVVSDDGSRVFFETPEALLPRDTNEVSDVYEWHDGKINLVSTGMGTKALYHDSSADGKTVFFTTFERLDPSRDTNNTRDLYVAQPGGGFPPLPVPPGCQGAGCQGDRPAPPVGQTGSQGVGEGNLVAAPKVSLKGKQLKQLAGKGRTTIKVKVAAPGKVIATLKGKVDGRKQTVAKATKTAKQAGTVSLTLKLSKKAQEQLRQTGKLGLTLEVRHSSAGSVVRKGVMLRG